MKQPLALALLGLMLASTLFAACGGSHTQEFGATADPTSVPGTPTPSPGASVGPEAPPPPLRDVSYRVEDGDTLSGIAEEYGVPMQQILQDNGLTDETSIAVDQILLIKGVDPLLAGAEPNPAASVESPIGFYLAMPIEGACLTKDDDQMPGAPRLYRYGIHEGVDFFTGFACVDVEIGAPVHAAYEGTVIRADQEYKNLTQMDLNELFELTRTQGYTDPGSLDKFRGRQVWIDHGNGIVTRYCHLGGMPIEIQPGAKVTQGQVIGYVGDTGAVESLSEPGYNKHLHFEVRVGTSYLGEGLSPGETRAHYEAAFHLR
jgi:murein DD-endopeptidase MepM/ murein hydrolase activator NlpD